MGPVRGYKKKRKVEIKAEHKSTVSGFEEDNDWWDVLPQRIALPNKLKLTPSLNVKKEAITKPSVDVKESHNEGGSGSIAAWTFTFRESAAATKNFRADCLLGKGGFGKVFKGYLESTNQVVAIKQLNRHGLQGNREFLVEVLMLSLLHHTNLVNLIGYCAYGDQRLLVYQFMLLGSLDGHLHDLSADKGPLHLNTRMKIAAGATKCLEYLHDSTQASEPFALCKMIVGCENVDFAGACASV